MLTLEEAKELKPGDILIDKNGRRWKVNGQVKRWKTDENRIRVPLKHGLYAYSLILDDDFDEDGKCELLSKGE